MSMNESNPDITDHGATLGRVLFYDKKLSVTNTVACASCHKQELAFADPVKGSEGINGQVTSRNSMAVVNVGFNNNLFWDSRAPSVKDLVSMPVSNHIEMGMENMKQVAQKLKKVDYYPALFEKAFGSTEITEERAVNALAQFVSAMVSSNSKWDEGAKTDFTNFTAQENMGRDLFFDAKAKCSQCHSGANFSAPDEPNDPYGGEVRGTANIGLDESYKDQGKGDGHFRIPTLRNAALTAPYMHDGRFATLAEVVDHYNENIKNHPNLDFRLRDQFGAPQKLQLTIEEKQALVAFLQTLTDQKFTTDAKFSDPFKI